MGHHLAAQAGLTRPDGYQQRQSPLVRRLDPRMRIIVLVFFAVTVVAAQQVLVPALALMFSFSLLLNARLPLASTLKRVAMMDSFIFVLLATLPFTTPGTPLFMLGDWPASREGFERALLIAFKANAIVMATLALISTMEAPTLAHALYRLKTPEKLVLLMMFALRYIEVIQQEYRRMRMAMCARAFKPGNNLHTYRSVGYLLGMLLVHSLERTERIVMAMKCRGFQGRFPIIDHFNYQIRDWAFLVISLFICVTLLLVEFKNVLPV